MSVGMDKNKGPTGATRATQMDDFGWFGFGHVLIHLEIG